MYLKETMRWRLNTEQKAQKIDLFALMVNIVMSQLETSDLTFKHI